MNLAGQVLYGFVHSLQNIIIALFIGAIAAVIIAIILSKSRNTYQSYL